MSSIKTAAAVAAESRPDVSRMEVEDFLYHEAALLDEWRLDEWLALFVEGATYEVPTAGAADDVDSASDLFYISDDYGRLQHRVRRLNKPGAHSEWPRSAVVRSISNVQITAREGDELAVRAVFITYRSKPDNTDTFFGHHLYRLRATPEGLRIVAKRSMLDMRSLRPQGRVSIIV